MSSTSTTDCNGSLSYKKLVCRGVSGSHVWIYHTTMIICIIVSLFALSVLLYKYFHDKSPLWNDRHHLFEPITGYLFWVTLHSICKCLRELLYNSLILLKLTDILIHFIFS